MSGSVVVGAIGIVGILLVMLFFKLGDQDKKHYLLQLLVLGFILGVIVLLGKVALDNQTPCGWLVNNSTVSGSTTSYAYAYTCSTDADTSNTSKTFYELTIWIMRVVGIYIFLYYAYEVLSYFGYLGKRRSE